MQTAGLREHEKNKVFLMEIRDVEIVNETDSTIEVHHLVVSGHTLKIVLHTRASDGGVCTCKKPIATTSTQNLCGNCGKPRIR